MGLDTVELVSANEEEFQIVISDEEAEQCVTPNLLIDLVFSKLRKYEGDTCPSMHSFYAVRREIMEHLNNFKSKKLK